MKKVMRAWAGVVLAIATGAPARAAQSQNLWLDVPFVHQAPEACGAASIAMVLRYWAKEVPDLAPQDADPATVQRLLLKPGAGGIIAADMERYFQEKGFRTFVFRGEWKDLEHHLAQGRPLIVCLKEGGGLGHSLHYVVVVGVDAGENVVLVNDPAGRKLAKLDRRNFEKRWNAMDHWTLLALPRQDR